MSGSNRIVPISLTDLVAIAKNGGGCFFVGKGSGDGAHMQAVDSLVEAMAGHIGATSLDAVLVGIVGKMDLTLSHVNAMTCALYDRLEIKDGTDLLFFLEVNESLPCDAIMLLATSCNPAE